MNSKNRPILVFKRLSEGALIPQYQTSGASGFDFVASEDALVEPGKVTLISTGLAVEIPEGYEIQVRARSGLSARAGLFLVNGVGTIDADYRGEIKIIASTCLNQPLAIRRGDRIAQGVLCRVELAEIQTGQDLSQTSRGAGGFGSTGVSSL